VGLFFGFLDFPFGLEWEVKRDESAVFINLENRVGVSGGKTYIQLIVVPLERRLK